jgi:amino acid transporter
MLCTMMSLGELAVMYPVNGGYYEYSVRFLDPSWLVTALLPSQTRMASTPVPAFPPFPLLIRKLMR